ncbi:MAG: hypothetical protein MI923_21785 [Phycisphaerales bacterium]|nr:hypothetical protein [Phycisphaerales bacterium]
MNVERGEAATPENARPAMHETACSFEFENYLCLFLNLALDGRHSVVEVF